MSRSRATAGGPLTSAASGAFTVRYRHQRQSGRLRAVDRVGHQLSIRVACSGTRARNVCAHAGMARCAGYFPGDSIGATPATGAHRPNLCPLVTAVGRTVLAGVGQLRVGQRRPQTGDDRQQCNVERSAEPATTAMNRMAATGRWPLSGQGRPQAGVRDGQLCGISAVPVSARCRRAFARRPSDWIGRDIAVRSARRG
jgi:hypothetical protein